MKNITLIGPSGVGKSTHAAALIEQFKMLHVSTGNLLRENVDNNTAMGFLAQRYMSFGELVPDEAVDALVMEKLFHRENRQGVLFDGFPRTVEQAHFLDEAMLDDNTELDAAVYLHISEEGLLSRIVGRLTCSSCQSPFHVAFAPPKKQGKCDFCGGDLVTRPDDIKEMVSVRLRAFHSVIGPIIKYYKESKRLILIDADASLEVVNARLRKAIEGVERRRSKRASVIRTIGSDEDNAPERMLTVDEATSQSCDLVLLGGPGAGKGSVAQELQTRLGVMHIGSSDLFRDKLDSTKGIGKLVKSYMDRGALVPDEVVEVLVEERLNSADAAEGFILDGFPRTLSQAYGLTQILNKSKRRLNAALKIEVSEDTLVQRLSGRRVCKGCRASYHLLYRRPVSPEKCDACAEELYQREDDHPSVVRTRIKTYQTQIDRILQYYRAAGILYTIDGEGTIEEVAERATTALHELL